MPYIRDNFEPPASHPKALWGLSLIYATFTLSLGVFLANLALFLKSQSGMSDDQSFGITAAFISLSFTTPLLGGYLCDKFGFRNATTVGLAFSFFGMMCIILPGHFTLFLGLSLFLVGNALCTPAIWSLVAMLYHKHDVRKESGSTLFYMLFNIGFLISNFCSGFIMEKLGYFTFFIFGAPLFVGFIAFLFMRGRFKTYAEIQTGERNYKGKDSHGIGILIVISILVTPVCYILLNYVTINSILIWVTVVISFLYLFKISRGLEPEEAKRLKAFMVLCIVGLAYLVIFSSEFDLLPVYAQGNIDRLIGGIELPAGIVTSLDPAYCILIGFVYSALWIKLDKINKNPALPTKFAVGLIFASLGYLLLTLLVYTHMASTFSILWLLLVFLFFVSGELLVVPIGIAMAGKLSPEGKEGICMGIWNLMTGAAAVLLGYLADFTVVPATDTISQSNYAYMVVFAYIGVTVLLLGIIMFFCRGFVKRLL